MQLRRPNRPWQEHVRRVAQGSKWQRSHAGSRVGGFPAQQAVLPAGVRRPQVGGCPAEGHRVDAFPGGGVLRHVFGAEGHHAVGGLGTRDWKEVRDW